MVVEKRQRFAGAVALNPEHHLAQLHRIGVVVHGIDAARDYLTQSLAIVERRRVVLTRAQRADIPRYGARHGQHDVARTAGGVAHLHVQERAHLLLGGGAGGYLLLDDRFERGAYEVLHEVGARVVARRALSVESAHEAKLPVLQADTRLHEGAHLEDALIDRAKLLDIERRVVDLHPCATLVGKLVEGGEGTQHVAVGHAALLEPVERVGAEEHTAQGLDAQSRAEVARFEEAEGVHQSEPQVAVLLLVQIGQLRQVAQARGGIMLLVDVLPTDELPVVGMVS